MPTAQQLDEAAAWNYYWKNNPGKAIAENSRPKEVIAFVAACQYKEQQMLSQPSEAVSESDGDAAKVPLGEWFNPVWRDGYLYGCNSIRQQLPQQQQQLQQQIDDLQKWKESAMVIMKDMQAIGKAIGVPLGQSIHDKILPAIQEMKQQQQQQRSYSEEDMYEGYKAENPLRISDGMKRQLFNKWLTKYNNK
jgi:hypothetical protein